MAPVTKVNDENLLQKSSGELDRLRLALSIDGALVYEWSLVDDSIVWSHDVSEILETDNSEDLKSGIGYSQFLNEDGAALRTNLAHNPSSDLSAFQIEYQFRTKSGEIYWLQDRGCRLADGAGKPHRIVGVLRSITDRKAHEVRLNYLASYDELTGLLNRTQFRERLNHVIGESHRTGKSAGYFMAAIDDLAVINTDYGFDIADEVIVGVGQRLKAILGPTSEIGRIAGNKFGIIVNPCGASELLATGQGLIESGKPLVTKTSAGSIPASLSIGCVDFPNHAKNSNEAMSRASEALESARKTGSASASAFCASDEVTSTRRRNALIADQIISALNDRRIVLAYQPIMSSETQKIAFYECLVRMVELNGDIVVAGHFIPLAEQLGLVRLLDRRVLELAMEMLYERKDVHLAVNVSGITATETGCIEGYLAYIEANRDVSSRLTVELTETAAISNIEESARFLSRLRGMGCKVAIDDFGAGYTSFRNLQALIVDSVKIDGSFVRGLAQSQDNQLFVRTLVDLAQYFNLDTVAEWVGSAQEATILRDLGVDFLQGFYLGEPSLKLLESESSITSPSSRTA